MSVMSGNDELQTLPRHIDCWYLRWCSEKGEANTPRTCVCVGGGGGGGGRRCVRTIGISAAHISARVVQVCTGLKRPQHRKKKQKREKNSRGGASSLDIHVSTASPHVVYVKLLYRAFVQSGGSSIVVSARGSDHSHSNVNDCIHGPPH
jgi:hypothetical protein